MKFIFASDSFKGSLSSEKTGKILEECLKNEIQGATFEQFLIADGGEGTLEAFLSRGEGKRVYLRVNDPLFREIDSYYIVMGNRAIIALSEASGLPLLKKEEQNPLNTTTYGTGELILHALKSGYRDIVVAIGGSATNDGGIGALSALGVKFLDKNGEAVLPVGASLGKIEVIDASSLCKEARDARFTVMCDVENRLTGKGGATYVYGPQKGANPEALQILETGMESYCSIIKSTLNIDANEIIGGGAAGGIGAGLSVFLGAKMNSGIDTLLDILDFDSHLKGCDYVISGEGRIDFQSACGKVIYGIGKRCLKYGVPLICIAGCLGTGYESVYDIGVKKIYTLVGNGVDEKTAISEAERIYRERAKQLFSELNK